MKRSGILHAELIGHLARLGDGDHVVIADRTMPIPASVPMIDLALVPGTLSVPQVLDAVLPEIIVQVHLVAREADDAVGGWLTTRAAFVGERMEVSQDRIREATAHATLAIRTGDETRCGTVVLECGAAT